MRNVADIHCHGCYFVNLKRVCILISIVYDFEKKKGRYSQHPTKLKFHDIIHFFLSKKKNKKKHLHCLKGMNMGHCSSFSFKHI